MSFLYPLFLISGITLAIPVLIHLFNLRKYKTVLFPHTRFLRNIQLNSRKQSQVRYKLLLLSRLLFLASLIFAFAQPVFNKASKTQTGEKQQIIYIDNSYSMGAKIGTRRIIDIAKEAAIKQIHKSKPGTKFILLTNDKLQSYQPLPANTVLNTINNIEVSASIKTVNDIVNTVQNLIQNENIPEAVIYYYSDFQKNSFPILPNKTQLKNITFIGIPIQADSKDDVYEIANTYIDTAYLTTPVLQTGKNNYLIVHTKRTGKPNEESTVLQLKLNGQIKNAVSLNLDKGESIDTLQFQVNNADWQQIELKINDRELHFDDTFRIAARSSPNLSILVVNEGQMNPYILASFKAYNGFRLNQTDINSNVSNWKDYNLVILNGVTSISPLLAKTINTALQNGQSIVFFPGKTSNIQSLNEGLKQIGDINITGIDTAVQAASTIQKGSNLVKNLFDNLPENVQLPVANWHYIVSAGLSANQQSVLSFRNGDPMLACYTPNKGKFYLLSSAADLQSGNIPGSYFFTPFLYEMAMQAGSSSVNAVMAGAQQSVYLSLANATERSTIHLFSNGIDAIPPQHADGTGIDVYIDEVTQQPGFYKLAAPTSDTVLVALNQNKSESQLIFKHIEELKKEWSAENIKWITINDAGNNNDIDNIEPFPIWKICVFFAIILLLVETFLLAKPDKKIA